MTRYDPWQHHLAAIGIPPNQSYALAWTDASGTRQTLELPPLLTPQDELGLQDAYSWVRAPGRPWSAARPRGDGVQSKRPQYTLSGPWEYDTREQALIDTAAISRAVQRADALLWCGRHLTRLMPGSTYRYKMPALATDVQHLFTLYTITTLTPELVTAAQLAEAQT